MSTLPMTRASYVFRVGDFGYWAGRPAELPEGVQGAGGVSLALTDACPHRSRRSYWGEYQTYRAVLGVPGRRRRRVAVEALVRRLEARAAAPRPDALLGQVSRAVTVGAT
jgi:hypothetical protein